MRFQKQRRCKAGFRAALTGFMLAMAAGCSTAQEKAASEAVTAQALMDGGDLPNARAAIIRSIAQRDDIADAHLLQARIEMAMRNPVGAYLSFSRALDLDAANPEALMGVAEIGLQVGRIREANTAADRILALDPASARALLVKGMIVLDEGRPPEALGYAEKILSGNPNDEGGVVLKARATALSGKHDEALATLQAASAVMGTTDALTVTAMEIQRARGDAKGLIGSFETILAKAPDNGSILIDYANTLYKTGNVAAARGLLAKGLDALGANETFVTGMTGLWQEYDPTPPDRVQIAKLGETGPPAARMVISRYLLETGRAAEAETVLRTLAFPKAHEAYALYGRILYALGDKAKAQAAADSVLSDDSDNGDALLLRAQLWMDKGRAKDAINDTQMVLRDDPLNGAAYALQAQAYEARKEAWRTRQLYGLGLDRLPQDSRLATRYLEFLYRSGDTALAMTVARKHARATPASLRAWKIYAGACERAGNPACQAEAQQGLAAAQHIFAIDLTPGTPRQRGLFGRL